MFIAEYLRDPNGRRAAIAAGYSEATAASQASRLLRSVNVKTQIDTAIAERVAKVQRDTGITLERTLREIAVLAYCELEDVRGLGLDKRAALDMLMKHLGGYKVDNEQKQPELAEQLAAFVGSLHESGAGRLPIAHRKPKA